MNEKKKWIKEIDLIKSLAIVLIVLSHLHDFVNIGNYNSVLIYLSGYIAFIGLSLFFFISGFSLYYNYKHISIKNLANFYRKRAVRIYPLFWLAIISVAVICFYYYGFLFVWHGYKVDYQYFIVAFLGLQGIFYQANPSVLYWFVGVILLYYLIYPFLVLHKSIKKIIIISLVVYGFFLVIHLKLTLIDPRFFLYYLPFIAGIVLCWLTDNNLNFKRVTSNYDIKFKLGSLILFLIFTLVYIIVPSIKLVYAKGLILYSLPLLAILSIYFAALIYKDRFVGKSYGLISKLSLSTYATFLFFSPVLFIIVALLNKFQIDTFYINYIVVFLGFPFVFFIGYYIQKLEFKMRLRLR